MTGTARHLVIEEKTRPYPMALVGPHHFRVRDAGPVDPSTVCGPAYSLYCLDPERRHALFVETPPGTDLAAAPFYFQAQYEAAGSLVAVPYEDLHALARSIEPGRLVLLYSVGRCGSTLLSRAFAATPGVWSLSEPDVFTQLITLREAGLHDAAEVAALVATCTRLLGAAAGDRVLVVKFRSFVVDLADVFHAHFPEARAVFLYRDGVPWTRSSARAFGSYDPAMVDQMGAVQDRLGRMVPLMARYKAAKGRVLTPVESLAAHWVGLMQRAQEVRAAGVPLFALRYEELTADPHPVLEALFVYCGLTPLPAAELDRVLAADSQDGTTISRSALEAVPEPDLSELPRIVGELSDTVRLGLVLPDTFMPPRGCGRSPEPPPTLG